MDKGVRKAIDGALDAAGGAMGGELFQDQAGPAVYRLEPSALTVVACVVCRYVGLIPSIPRKPELIWTCQSCGKRHALRPPARVWVEGSRPTITRVPAPPVH